MRLKTTLELKRMATKLRIDDMEMLHRANSGHTGSSLSAIDILVALYFGEIRGKAVCKYDPKKPDWEGQDYVVMSKGHGCPAWYVVLAELGFFPREELNHLRQVNSLLQGHPVREIPGVSATTGSLGHGLSQALGMALALKLDVKANRVYVILGDGEINEGQIWEAAMAAAHFKTDNLTAFLDYNRLQMTGPTHTTMELEPLRDKWEAFGWHTVQLKDGHDFDELLLAIEKAWKTKRKPTMIICPTIKGKGVPFAEGKHTYHGVALSKEEMAVAIPLFKKQIEELDAALSQQKK